jgi:hypothetical protein
MDIETKNEIIKLVNETEIADINSGLRDRHYFKFVADACETIAQIMFGIAGIFAFSASIWKTADYLGFISGGISVGAFAIKGFGSYAMSESKERTMQTNKILSKYKIDTLIDITDINSSRTNQNSEPI